MRKEWNSRGEYTESELANALKEAVDDYGCFVAFQTDRFLAGKDLTSLERIAWDKLLEIRLFSEEKELFARRTMIGASNRFQWREASEEELTETDYLVRYQTLDIDARYTKTGENGNLQLLTTGGGRYELPIDESMKYVKVISYITYDETDGMASIYDNRLAGFCKERRA